jgi:hypothetical protein
MRKAMVVSLLMLLVVAAAAAWAVWQVVTYVPHFYLHAEPPPGPARQQASRLFESQLHNLFVNDIRYESSWQATLQGHELNSWLAEDFVRSNLAALLPPKISEPRVVFREDRVWIGFKYEVAGVPGLVSIELKVWLAPHEPNAIVLQVERFRFGALPLAPKLLQEEFGERIRQQNVKVLWYRYQGHPTVVLRLQADQREPSVLVQAIEVSEGRLNFKGRSLDPDLRRPPSAPPPPPVNR